MFPGDIGITNLAEVTVVGRFRIDGAKEIELLWTPAAVLSAAALAWAWARGAAGRVVAVLAMVGALGWCLARDVSLYVERFLAVGR